MADNSEKANPYTSAAEEAPEVELRNPRMAMFLGWLLPGLGHLYQGRTGKGLLFMITILSTFAYGMYLGDGRVVYASTTNPVKNFSAFKERWHYACQLGIGLPAMPAYLQTWRVENGARALQWFDDNFERPPYQREQVRQLYSEGLFGDQEGLDIEKQYFSSTDESTNLVTHAGEREKWHHDLAYFFELGTVYTMIAGLLNILAICDARWGPLVSLPPPIDDKT